LTLPASTKGQESPEENEMLKFSQKRIKDAKRRMTFQGIIMTSSWAEGCPAGGS